MDKYIEKIDNLDLSLFEAIPPQMGTRDKRSLLAVQRATASKCKEYAYLEIGSHLGGSIQPHLVDDRCKRIYSIDLRPTRQADDRSPDYTAHYDDNSTQRMLELLGGLGHGDLEKITCFDLDASDVDPGEITSSPRIAFIDGEHTREAVLSDFQFCHQVVHGKGTILFHDFDIIYPAVFEICDRLSREEHVHLAFKLDREVFAIFFDPDLVHADPSLASMYRRRRSRWFAYQSKKGWKKFRVAAKAYIPLRARW